MRPQSIVCRFRLEICRYRFYLVCRFCCFPCLVHKSSSRKKPFYLILFLYNGMDKAALKREAVAYVRYNGLFLKLVRRLTFYCASLFSFYGQRRPLSDKLLNRCAKNPTISTIYLLSFTFLWSRIISTS